MEDNETDEMLQEVLISYAHERGGTTMQELVPARSREYARLAKSMDCVRWQQFMEGMISLEVIAIQDPKQGF